MLVYARQLPEVVDLVRAFPSQRFVLDHLGKPDVKGGGHQAWRPHFEELASFPHVWCKLSGLVTEADWRTWTAEQLRPYIETALECFGPERLMIGSDWPVCTLASPYMGTLAVVEDALAGCSFEGAGQHPRRHSPTSVESVGVFMDLMPASATAAPMSRLWDPAERSPIACLAQSAIIGCRSPYEPHADRIGRCSPSCSWLRPSIAGCSKTSQQSASTSSGSGITIAVIPKGTTHEFWQSIHAGANKAAKELGIDVIWRGPLREDDRDAQVSEVEGFISRGVSGIALAPLDESALVGPVSGRHEPQDSCRDLRLGPEGRQLRELRRDRQPQGRSHGG